MDTEQRAAILDLRERPRADPDDVRSPEAIVRALYDSISGPAEKEQERSWDRVRSLFFPAAQLILVRWSRPDGEEEQVLRAWDVEGFIAVSKHFYPRAASSNGTSGTARSGSGTLPTCSAPTSPGGYAEDREPIMRGINSVQVVHDGARWWIAHLVWDVQRPTHPIPEAYLPEPE